MRTTCPLLIGNDHKFYPTNTCRAIWSYCMQGGDYNECDIYKRHERQINWLAEEFKKSAEKN